jgi:hypothetical protein
VRVALYRGLSVLLLSNFEYSKSEIIAHMQLMCSLILNLCADFIYFTLIL